MAFKPRADKKHLLSHDSGIRCFRVWLSSVISTKKMLLSIILLLFSVAHSKPYGAPYAGIVIVPSGVGLPPSLQSGSNSINPIPIYTTKKFTVYASTAGSNNNGIKVFNYPTQVSHKPASSVQRSNTLRYQQSQISPLYSQNLPYYRNYVYNGLEARFVPTYQQEFRAPVSAKFVNAGVQQYVIPNVRNDGAVTGPVSALQSAKNVYLVNGNNEQQALGFLQRVNHPIGVTPPFRTDTPHLVSNSFQPFIGHLSIPEWPDVYGLFSQSGLWALNKMQPYLPPKLLEIFVNKALKGPKLAAAVSNDRIALQNDRNVKPPASVSKVGVASQINDDDSGFLSNSVGQYPLVQ